MNMMKALLAVIATLAGGCGVTPGTRQPADARTAVEATLRAYERALNAADVDAIVPLYETDGVFMAQHNAPAVGAAAIDRAYRAILEQIRLEIRFEIDEVEVVGRTAWARTQSRGRTTIRATGVVLEEGNQELFILSLGDDGEWRIARYIFSTTRPRT